MENEVDELLSLFESVIDDLPQYCVDNGVPLTPMVKDPYSDNIIRAELFPKQREVYDTIINNDGSINTVVIGGAFGGGKTMTALICLTTLAQKYPGSHWTVVRATLVNCRRTVVKYYRKFFSEFYESENKSENTFYFKNGSQIVFAGENRQDDPEFDWLKSYDTNGVFIEQGEEISEEFYEMLLARVGRWNIFPQPPSFVLMSLNPTNTWSRDRFYEPFRRNTLPASARYIPMLITDNPGLSLNEAYMAKFEDMSDLFRRAYLGGDWDALLENSPWLLVQPSDLARAEERWHKATEADIPGLTCIGADMVRGGTDNCVLAPWHEWYCGTLRKIVGEKIRDGEDAALWIDSQFPNTECRIAIDSVGIGSSGFDFAKKMLKGRIIPFQGSTKAYKRTKAGWKFDCKIHAAWYLFGQALAAADCELALPPDAALKSQLISRMRGEVKNGVLKVETKTDYKKRTGKSPDEADAVIMGWWENNRAAPVSNQFTVNGQ